MIIGDDQDEWFFEDNMPALSVYWGETAPLIPRTMPPGSRDAAVIEAIRRGYGDVAMDVPVASGFGRYLIEYLIEHDFDVAHMRYVKQPYGGSVARRYPTKQGELDYVRETATAAAGAPARVLVRRQAALRQQAQRDPAGLPEHLLPAEPADAPALLRDRRSRRGRRSKSGRATRRSPSSPRAGSATSSSTRSSTAGCSARSSGTTRRRCARIPRHRLHSAASESLNWVALGGAMQRARLKMELLDYVPVYRTPAGTGGGWAFARWR